MYVHSVPTADSHPSRPDSDLPRASADRRPAEPTSPPNRPPADARADHGPGPLSPRESEVVTRLAHGETNVEIARKLWMSPRTVQAHLASASRKRRARNRTHLVVLAIAHGDVPFPAVTPSDEPEPTDPAEGPGPR